MVLVVDKNMSMEHWQTDHDRNKPKHSKKILS